MNPSQPPLEISPQAKECVDKMSAHFAYNNWTCEMWEQAVQEALNQSRAADRKTIAEKDRRIRELEEVNSGISHVYERLMEIQPWSESNDMNWEDEMDCGFDMLQEHITQLETQILGLRKAIELHCQSYWGIKSPPEVLTQALSSTPAPSGELDKIK